MKTVICGIDGSPGARSALRVAAVLAERMSARLVAVHVRDRSADGAETAERTAVAIIADEVPGSDAQARGATGDVAERLAAIAESENALMIVVGARRRGRSRAFLRARSAVGLVGLTDVPVLVTPLPARSTVADAVDPHAVARRSPVPVAAAPDVDRGGQAPADRVRPARSTVEEQRRLRRTSRVALRPGWSRGTFLGKRPRN
ncbi:universal stress protein [Actinophytocola sp. NPDC049390]|uniref:universal stress protein n=1 Tax=Actinophytocola sp. NPDC049390 TaxID=3363894 RepID=UPI0037B736D5